MVVYTTQYKTGMLALERPLVWLSSFAHGRPLLFALYLASASDMAGRGGRRGVLWPPSTRLLSTRNSFQRVLNRWTRLKESPHTVLYCKMKLLEHGYRTAISFLRKIEYQISEI
jgi:hypothetical protein